MTPDSDEREPPSGDAERSGDVSESGKTRDELLTELDTARQRVRELERQLAEFADLEGPSGGPRAMLQGTLTRVLKKACMILQAEKSVLLIYNRESGELVAQVPAVGLAEEQLQSLKLRATEGVAGEVFRTNESRIVADVNDEPAGAGEFPTIIGWRNALVIPLVVESKDRDQVVIDRTTIGVMTVFNKRRGKGFSADDLRLSRVLARNAAAIIAEAKLFSDVLEQKQMIEKSLESLHSGIMMVSGDGTVRLMNKAARHLFSLGPATEPIGRDYVEVVSHPDAVDALSRSLSEQRDIDREMTFDDDRRFFQVQTAVVRDGETMSGIVAIFTDITEIRNLERLKATFVTTISHELGTPLAAILGFTRTMLDDGEGFFSPDVRTEFLQIIEKECTRLHRLVNDLRNMARIEEKGALELHAARMDLPDLVRGVVAAQRSYATHHTFRIEMTSDFEEAPLVADKDKVDQILTNLVNNAVKYSPSGGEVLIRGEKTPAGVSIAITDQGIGIPEDQIERIFERFHKVSAEQSGRPDGAGIGLYIVRHLVELHGGSIQAESTFGEGSTFTVELPLVPHRPEEPLRGDAGPGR